MPSRVVLRRLIHALVLGLAEAAVVLGLAALLAAPTSAQNRSFGDRFPFLQQRNRHNGGGGGGGFFGGWGGGGWGGGGWGGGGWGGGGWGGNEQRPAAPVVENNSKAPPPAKRADTGTPLTSVVVLGDSMADWLAYGLEQAAADSPDIGILRRHRTYSGLIRIEVKNDPRGEYPDWPQAARDILNADKPNFIVVMIGLNDRRSIRDKAPAPAKNSHSSSNAPAAANASPADRNKDAERDAADDAPAEAATVEPPAPAGMVNYEFRSDKWNELYIKRIDEFIAVLKARNVPVFWVGLPPVRNPKVSPDLSYLNDLYRSRAEKAGITYIDTWDGFVDEQGRFVMQGPDFEGQIRRLRSGDGNHFTQSGARKLAHYVEREIQRALMTHATPVALPTVDEPASQAPTATKPGNTANAVIARPLAGPVMPLTTPAEADELVGGTSPRQVAVDPIASRVLVRGEPNRVPFGRADDFTWPRHSVQPLGTDPIVATSTTPLTPMQPYETRQAAAAPTAAPAQRIGPPAPGPAQTRHAASAQQRHPSWFGSWQQPYQQQQSQRAYQRTQQPYFFPFFGGR